MAGDNKATVNLHIKTSADDKALKEVKEDLQETTQAAGETAEKMETAAEAVAEVTEKMEGASEATEEVATSLDDAATAADGANSALGKTGAAAKASTGAAQTAVESASKAMTQAVDDAEEALEELVEEAGEAGDKAGKGFKEKLEEKTKGIVWTQDTLTAAEKAWELGSIIGDQLGKAMSYYLENGTLDGFFESWLEDIASRFGILTDSWEINLQKIKDATDQSLAESKKQYAEWLESLSKEPTQDAITWLKQLQEEAKTSMTQLRELQALQQSIRRAAMDKIGQDEADELDRIDADPVLPESMKIQERQKARRTAELARLEQRRAGRADQTNATWNAQLAAQEDLASKEAVEQAQMDRARAWSDMKATADANSIGKDKKVDEKAAELNFAEQARQRGITDMSYGEDERKKAEDAVKARKDAEQAVREAEQQHNALRRRMAVEDATDVSNTGRTLTREQGQADRQSNAAGAQEAAAVQKDEEARKAAETARLQAIGDESMTNAASELDKLIALAENGPLKQQMQALAASLTDADGATAADVAKIQSFLENLKTSNAEANRQIQAAFGSMATAQQNFSAEMRSFNSRLQTIESRSNQ